MKGRPNYRFLVLCVALGCAPVAFGGDPAPAVTRTSAPQLTSAARAPYQAARGAGQIARRIPAQVVITPNPNVLGPGADTGGYGGFGVGGGYPGNNGGGFAGNGGFGLGNGVAYGAIARVAVAPVGTGFGGLRYVTRPTYVLYSQSVARGFFTASGVNMGGGLGVTP